jgi:RimJ/RimL family protein N-acetyltransferase
VSEPRRFRLRPLRLDDIDAVAGWYESVDDLALFHRRLSVPIGADALREQWRELLAAGEPRESYWFGIEAEDGALAGFAGIEDIAWAHGDALTPLFVASGWRRSGIGIRTRALLLDLAFDQLRLARITSIHRADNAGSVRLNAACGLREEGRLREAWFAGGARVDLLVHGILADEWRRHRPTLRDSLSPDTVVTLGASGPEWAY